MNNVIVEYNDFSKDKSKVEKITFDLLPNVSLILSQEQNENETDESAETENENTESNGILSLSMIDKQTDQTEITGSLDEETLNALIRSLTIFRSQIS